MTTCRVVIVISVFYALFVDAEGLCDDITTTIDLPSSSKTRYKCSGKRIANRIGTSPPGNCTKSTHPPIHVCTSEKITYNESVPSSGAHRLEWAAYGEYDYCPPQRWIHNLEHGGVVFLYHPCAPEVEVDRLKFLARSCLRRHIITPHLNMTKEMPLALVTWGCVYTMSHVNFTLSSAWIREHALQAPEAAVSLDGQYRHWLIQKASEVNGSNDKDEVLCPNSDGFLQRFLATRKQNEIVTNTPRTTTTNFYWGIGVLIFLFLSIVFALLFCRRQLGYPRSAREHRAVFTKDSQFSVDSGQVALLSSRTENVSNNDDDDSDTTD
ncbi:uncharacterized protein [Oscarella lobularis]|uniref:uncharacterized protein isoform X2 n=1 Tax=Oscarella lobularis TaxID=121494 RepID=UPI0033143229